MKTPKYSPLERHGNYVGKDIAYHLWKFGLLGKDFGYKPFFTYADHECWISAEHGDEPHPISARQATYNVIDVRPERSAGESCSGTARMGFVDQADHCIHFGYEKVALTRAALLISAMKLRRKISTVLISWSAAAKVRRPKRTTSSTN